MTPAEMSIRWPGWHRDALREHHRARFPEQAWAVSVRVRNDDGTEATKIVEVPFARTAQEAREDSLDWIGAHILAVGAAVPLHPQETMHERLAAVEHRWPSEARAARAQQSSSVRASTHYGQVF